MKKFFRKIGDWVRNTAWIQPLLIVVVIFLVLFLLNPIKTGITNLWTSITTRNNMESITYGEYIDKVNESIEKANDNDSTNDEKLIFVFVQKGCEHCAPMYDVMNTYLKEIKRTGENQTIKIYSVSLNTKTNSDDVLVYRDKTMGEANGSENDYVKRLDDRINNWVLETGSTVPSSNLQTVSDSMYDYVATPLFLWYDLGIEVKISNNFDSLVTTNADGDKSYTSFKSFISFPKTSEKPEWNDDFNLTYSGQK